MYQKKFKKSERSRRRKAMIVTIAFHLILLGGLTFGTDLGVTIKDAVKSLIQGEDKPAPKEKALVMKK